MLTRRIDTHAISVELGVAFQWLIYQWLIYQWLIYQWLIHQLDKAR